MVEAEEGQEPTERTLSEVEGLGGDGNLLRRELEEVGIDTVEQLASADPKTLAESTTIPERWATELVEQAQGRAGEIESVPGDGTVEKTDPSSTEEKPVPAEPQDPSRDRNGPRYCWSCGNGLQGLGASYCPSCGVNLVGGDAAREPAGAVSQEGRTPAGPARSPNGDAQANAKAMAAQFYAPLLVIIGLILIGASFMVPGGVFGVYGVMAFAGGVGLIIGGIKISSSGSL